MKKGDRVLVEAEYDHDCAHRSCIAEAGEHVVCFAGEDIAVSARIQPDPGVPIANLVRECDLRKKQRLEVLGDGEYQEMLGLIAAREAAAKPQYAEGQEVWVRSTVMNVLPSGRTAILVCSDGGEVGVDGVFVDLDTIRPVED